LMLLSTSFRLLTSRRASEWTWVDNSLPNLTTNSGRVMLALPRATFLSALGESLPKPVRTGP
jgi:hypothetical protein